MKAVVDPTFQLIQKNTEQGTAKYLEYRRRWNENPKNFLVEDFPVHLDLEANTTCNLRCYMCFHSYDKPKPAVMQEEIFQKAIDEGVAKGLCSVKLQYRGEPLLDPYMAEKIRYGKERGLVEVSINTNAMLLDEERAKKIIASGLDKLICSVDGCTKEVYENIRIGASFEVVLNNIRRFQAIKKTLNVEKPILRVQMVDTPRNHHQKEEYFEFWGKIADQVAIEEMLDWEANKEDFESLPQFACAQLWQRLLVLADGDVLPCCRATNGGNAKLEVLGNVKEKSLGEIWKGDRLNEMREMHRRGESHKLRICRLCGLRKTVAAKVRKA